MDIDDLLAEVSVDSTLQESRDLQELTRCWVAERVAPEILTWPSEVMDRVLERIRKQVRCRLALEGTFEHSLHGCTSRTIYACSATQFAAFGAHARPTVLMTQPD